MNFQKSVHSIEIDFFIDFSPAKVFNGSCITQVFFSVFMPGNVQCECMSNAVSCFTLPCFLSLVTSHHMHRKLLQLFEKCNHQVWVVREKIFALIFFDATLSQCVVVLTTKASNKIDERKIFKCTFVEEFLSS